jgi:nitrilase
MTTDAVRVAVVQRPPALLDGPSTIAAAVDQVHEVADAGARLAVFPEAYVPGYPVWIWYLRPGPDYALTSELHAALLANSVDLDGDDLAALRAAAAERSMTVVCGVHERDGRFGRSTIYNTLVTIGPDGTVLNRHRKLVPTNPERMVWGEGDGRGLRVVETPIGRLGGLICWENYMPLARVALYAEGVEVYVACTWDSGDTWLATMRHIAAEGRCFVIGSGCSLAVSDIPKTFPSRDKVFADLGTSGWINPGDSVVVRPGGEIIAGPLHEEHGIVYAELDVARAASERRTLDVVGHYARNDVFELSVDRTARAPVSTSE